MAVENKRIAGMAAVFNQRTEIMGRFEEQIAPGAFRDAIHGDVTCLLNHDPNHVLGRTLAGSLRLEETAVGLAFGCDINASDPGAVAVHGQVRRGDLRGCSFSFDVLDEAWAYPKDRLPVRTILKVGTLYDVGPVTFPAYKQTVVDVVEGERARRRSAHASVELSRARLRRVVNT